MNEPVIPGAVDLPDLAPDEQAFTWTPSDLYATGWLMGLLSSRDIAWHLGGGLGDAAWLSVERPEGTLTARPGDCVVLASDDRVRIRSAEANAA